MKASRPQVDCAILFFAKKYNLEKSYDSMFKSFIGLPTIVQALVYEMFINEFCPYYISNEEREQYDIIYEYVKELKKKGYVNFDE